MAQPYNLGPVDGPRSSGSAGAAASGTKPVPADVLLLGPRDERDFVEPAPPKIDMAPAKTEKSDLRPAPASYMPAPRKNQKSRRTIMIVAALAVVGIGIPSWAYLRSGAGAPPASGAPAAATAKPTAAPAAVPDATQGSASIISRPDGAQVFVNGMARGVTPMTLTLPVGTYTLELQNSTSKRSLPLIVEAGAVVRQYVDLAPNSGDAGRLEVMSDPAGAQVLIDGTPRGQTPLSLASIEPGQHRVTISNGENTVNRTVNVSAGATASVVASLAPAGAAGGWISVDAPFDMDVLENGRVIGTTATEKLMLPAGRHEIELVSAAFGIRTAATVQVPAGKTVTVPVNLPKGTISINALPWADVWLDGQPLGTTPLGNMQVTVGNHEVMWRHPQFGERRQTIKVTGSAPVRASVDFSK
jgi:hypothetical protein